MLKTVLTIKNEDFYINNEKVYSNITGSDPSIHGLLMNARFIQGIFDDKEDVSRYNRFGKEFDAERNTDELIKELPRWYEFGLRAFTVGFQGGGPCFTIKNNTIHNNPFGEDGKKIDEAYDKRMDRLIKAADSIGMVVIVNFFYPGQIGRLKDGQAVIDAVKASCEFLKRGGYTNVIIDIVNEQNIQGARSITHTSEGIVSLINIARMIVPNIPIGCSLTGGKVDKQIATASDVILIHGNACSRHWLYKLIEKAREFSPGKPVLCNEDSQAIGNMGVAYRTHSSWGYYNNITKQEPPTDWSITKGEDEFFAYRMAQGIGIKLPEISFENQFYLQGFEEKMFFEGKRWIRLASLYPESIDYIEFYRNGELYYTCFDEPFTVSYTSNWSQKGTEISSEDKEWKAIIHLNNGSSIEKNVKIEEKC